MEERRRSDDKNWDEIFSFIHESREYRAADIVRQEYFKNKVDSIESQVKKTNGRVDGLEEWQDSIKTKIQDRQDKRSNTQSLITIIATIVMAVSALVMIFKK